MSLGWVIAGTVVQLILGCFLFMLAVFSGAGIANGNHLSKLQIGILDFSMFALPVSCILSTGIVIYLYKSGAGASSYWWYCTPVILTALYVLFVLKISGP